MVIDLAFFHDPTQDQGGSEGLLKAGALKKLTGGLQWVGSASEDLDGSQLGFAQQAADEATPQGGAFADHRTS